MLQNNQPYWYALPRPTQTKLARLRVRATGRRRKSGCPKGYKAASNSPDGRRTRTLKALSQLYQAEGLPPMQAPKPAEQRALAAMGLAEFVSALAGCWKSHFCAQETGEFLRKFEGRFSNAELFQHPASSRRARFG